MKNFEELFESFSNGKSEGAGSGLILLPAAAPIPIYYGIGGHGYFRLAFLVNTLPPEFPSTRAIKVSVVDEGDTSHWVFFDLVEASARAVYFTFCDDLVRVLEKATVKDDESALIILKNRFLAWRKMFRQERSGLSEEQIIGLLGELYFLHEFMIPEFGAAAAVSAWSGIDGLSKDFAIGDKWYEIKTASVNANTVKINSLTQLSSETAGALVVVRYEAMADSYDDPNCSVYKVFRAIMSEIDDDEVRAAFISKLISFGFDVTTDAEGHKFRITEMSKYRVDDKFPRIQDKDITRKEIDKVTYCLIINSLEDFKFDGRL